MKDPHGAMTVPWGLPFWDSVFFAGRRYVAHDGAEDAPAPTVMPRSADDGCGGHECERHRVEGDEGHGAALELEARGVDAEAGCDLLQNVGLLRLQFAIGACHINGDEVHVLGHARPLGAPLDVVQLAGELLAA